MKATYVLVGLLLVLAMLSLWLYLDLQELQSINEDLKTSLQELNYSYQLYKATHRYTNEEYNALLSNYTKLALEHQKLQGKYTSLKFKYEGLMEDYERFTSAYSKLIRRVNLRWDKSDLKVFVTPMDHSVEELVYEITGGWSDLNDFNEFWRDVKAMYMWIARNIKYRYDGLYPVLPSQPWGHLEFQDEIWQFPNETIELMMGDCEDQAILLCSMIRCYTNMKYKAECIWIISSTAGHVAVQIPVDEGKLVILDPAGGYYTHDYLGNIIARDINKEIGNWLNYWKPEMGGDVYVYRVFSDYLDREFESTSEYLQWMYSR